MVHTTTLSALWSVLSGTQHRTLIDNVVTSDCIIPSIYVLSMYYTLWDTFQCFSIFNLQYRNKFRKEQTNYKTKHLQNVFEILFKRKW